jgi:hypothetical protein
VSARVRSATRSSRLFSERRRITSLPRLPDRPLAAVRCARPLVCGGGEGVQAIVLAGIAAREQPHLRRELGWDLNHRLAGRGEPLWAKCLPNPPAFSMAQSDAWGSASLRAFEGSQAFSRFCGKLAHSRSSPTSLTAATATLTPCGDLRRSAPASVTTSVSEFALWLACVKDTPTLSRAHTSFESPRTPRSLRWDASLDTSQPFSNGRQDVGERSLNWRPRSLQRLQTTELLTPELNKSDVG